MSGPASIRNAYIAQGVALAALAVVLVLNNIGTTSGDLFFFQAPAAAAAFVLCLWSLKLSITAALTQPWRHPVVIWILVALELNAPAVWLWLVLVRPRNVGLGVWGQNLCGIGLPALAPVLTVAGIIIALVLKFRARLRFPKLTAALLLTPLFGFVLPCALYLQGVLTWDGAPILPQQWIVKYTPGIYKTAVDRAVAWVQPSNYCHVYLCRFGELPNQRLKDIILTDPSNSPPWIAFRSLHDRNVRTATALCVEFALRRTVSAGGNTPEDDMGNFLAREGSDAELRAVTRGLELCPPVFRRHFLAAVPSRNLAVEVLKNEVFEHARFDDDVIKTLAGREPSGDGMSYSGGIVAGGFVPWADLLEAKDNNERVPPLYSLYTDCASSDAATRRTAVFVLAVTLKFPRTHTPLPNYLAATGFRCAK